MLTENPPLVHLPRRSPSTPDPQLPRGGCRFLLRDPSADGSRQRCSCASFFLNKSLRGAVCGCGHHAWHHEADQPRSWVTMDEHLAVVKRFEEELERERAARRQQLQELKTWVSLAMQAPFQAMAQLKMHMDDKVESAMDSTQACHDKIDALSTRLGTVQEVTVEHENKLDLLESSRGWQSRPLTPMPEIAPKMSIPGLLVRSEDKTSEPWSVRIILVPSRWQQFAFEYDSAAYKRCQSRNLHQDVCLSDHSSRALLEAVERGFASTLRGRPWMPLLCFRSLDKSLGQLPQDKRTSDRWDYAFLEAHCLASDKAQGEVLYIAPQQEELTWHEIRALPAIMNPDESCWAYVSTLDGPSNWPLPGTAAAENASTELRVKPLNANAVCSYSPPPYSSRVSVQLDRDPTALEVLATSASLLPPRDLGLRQQRADSAYGVPNEVGPPTCDASDGEHRFKKPKLHTERSESSIRGVSASGATQHQQQQQQPRNTVFYSGRTKRKMAAPGKNKEPVRFNVGDLKNPMSGLLHRHEGKGQG